MIRPALVLFLLGTWSLHVLWDGGEPLGSGREWTLYQGIDSYTCFQLERQVTGPIKSIWCESRYEQRTDDH